MNVMRSLLLVGMVVLVPQALRADRSQLFIGNTTVGGNWQRPLADGSGIATSAGPMRYVTQEFKLHANTVCSIVSAQGYDGVLLLYRAPFDPAAPLANFIAGSDDAALGDNAPVTDVGSSFIENVALTGEAENGTTYVLVTTGFRDQDYGAFQNFVTCDDDRQPTQGSCGRLVAIDPLKTVCLQDRFLTAIFSITNHPGDGVATPVPTGTNDTALFWFYNDRNWEAMVKVLDGCAINGYWWVFAAGLTNQGYVMSVTDTRSSTFVSFTNNQGERAPAYANTTAFPCN